uniref:Uncharacterized protein n=1 Tax=Trichuris muris TaxID=70415 RepID=A0A5S6QSX7_TRIMR
MAAVEIAPVKMAAVKMAAVKMAPSRWPRQAGPVKLAPSSRPRQGGRIDWLTLDYCVSCGIMGYVCELVPSLRGCAKLTVHGYFFVKDKCRGDKYYCRTRTLLNRTTFAYTY